MPTVRDQRLLEDPVRPTLARLAAPMVGGIVAIMLFNVVDTFWVGRLGPDALAAMGFIFPVSFVLKAIMIGLGIGVTATISRLLGSGNEGEARYLTTDSLLLGLLLVTTISALGLFAMNFLFRLLGASSEILPLIRSYMRPWFFGIALLVVPMVGNSAIRATGDTKSPAFIMILAGFINAAFDPVLIFGLGPFPKMGLKGAAVSSVCSWCIALIASGWILGRRLKMLQPGLPGIQRLLRSWKPVLAIGTPAAATNLLAPLTMAVVIRLVAEHGAKAVAGFGVATRIQSLSMVGLMALGAAMTPFIGQNFGAKAWGRIREALRSGVQISFLLGGLSLLLLASLAPELMGLFSSDQGVVSNGTLFLRILPWSYWAVGIALVSASVFNALRMPMKAASLVVIRLLVLAVPSAWLGNRFFGVCGIFAALALSNCIGAVIGFLWVRHEVQKNGRSTSSGFGTADSAAIGGSATEERGEIL